MADTDGVRGEAPLSQVRAIVLDANAFGSRQLHLRRLQELVKRAEAHGQLQVWVPKSVVWEWAEHAHAERVAAAQALRHIRATGLTLPELTEVSREDVLAEVESLLDRRGEALVILPIDAVAAEALRDQILVLGPGKTRFAKDGRAIKTGASDSASLRAVLEYAGNDPATFVIVSRDADVRNAFKN